MVWALGSLAIFRFRSAKVVALLADGERASKIFFRVLAAEMIALCFDVYFLLLLLSESRAALSTLKKKAQTRNAIHDDDDDGLLQSFSGQDRDLLCHAARGLVPTAG